VAAVARRATIGRDLIDRSCGTVDSQRTRGPQQLQLARAAAIVLRLPVVAVKVRCPGCSRDVDVTAPPDMKHEVVHGYTPDGARFVEIRIARMSLHRCLECPDGVWR
jgi:hypothetical protein